MTSHAKIVERVLAVVEGEMVLLSDLFDFKKKLQKKQLVNENLIDLFGVNEKSSQNKILDYLIAQKIIVLHGKKDLNINDIEDLASGEITNLAKQNNISPEQLKKEISSRGINFEDYKDFIGKSSLIRSTLEKNVISQVRPTQEDLVSYLKQNGVTNIQSSFSYNLDQIFVPLSEQKILDKINSESFRTYFSESSKFNLDVLSLDNIGTSDLSKTHSDAIKSLEEGQISKPIKENSGYRIFYIKNKSGDFRIPNTPQVQKLQKTYYEERVGSQFKLWYNELKSGFFIRKNEN